MKYIDETDSENLLEIADAVAKEFDGMIGEEIYNGSGAVQENIVRYVDVNIGGLLFSVQLELWAEGDEGAVNVNLYEGHWASKADKYFPTESSRVSYRVFSMPPYSPDTSELPELLDDLKEEFEELEAGIEVEEE